MSNENVAGKRNFAFASNTLPATRQHIDATLFRNRSLPRIRGLSVATRRHRRKKLSELPVELTSRPYQWNLPVQLTSNIFF
ncbi:hypothetical protein B5X24_HaOG203854 [Helicoverpa armigera]|nr:hypothetical protein B5X24_HaOG203854 [Helicoverpa armigera]